VLTPGEIRLLLAQLAELYHTMVVVAACLGLRASEIVGLQWQDFNWEDLTVLIRRGVVNGRSGDTKTEASQSRSPSILGSPVLWRNYGNAHCTKALKTGSSPTKVADPEDNRTSCNAI
jgi:hypothetical protein